MLYGSKQKLAKYLLNFHWYILMNKRLSRQTKFPIKEIPPDPLAYTTRDNAIACHIEHLLLYTKDPLIDPEDKRYTSEDARARYRTCILDQVCMSKTDPRIHKAINTNIDTIIKKMEHGERSCSRSYIEFMDKQRKENSLPDCISSKVRLMVGYSITVEDPDIGEDGNPI